jgi:hypothetical protein
MEKNGQLHSTISLIPSFALNRMLCGPKSRYWHFGEEKSLLSLLKIEARFLYLPATALVTLHTGALPAPMYKL